MERGKIPHHSQRKILRPSSRHSHLRSESVFFASSRGPTIATPLPMSRPRQLMMSSRSRTSPPGVGFRGLGGDQMVYLPTARQATPSVNPRCARDAHDPGFGHRSHSHARRPHARQRRTATEDRPGGRSYHFVNDLRHRYRSLQQPARESGAPPTFSYLFLTPSLNLGMVLVPAK